MCNCDPNLHPDFCQVCARDSLLKPEYKIIGQRSAFYCIEKNGMPMTDEQVLAALQNSEEE